MKFENMSQQKKRIALCEDVIAQCKRPNVKIRAATGYFKVRGRPKSVGCRITDKQECTVCAKGGMMLALIGKQKLHLNFDNQGKYSCLDESEIISALNDVFTEDELDAIEALFEGWSFYGYAFREYHNFGGSNHFSEVKPARKRLIGIMGNIIANGGDLVYSQGPIFHRTVQVSLL